MAQVAIREYDVKRMFSQESSLPYNGIQIREFSDIWKLDPSKKYVLKPDMLFGKRGKRWLVGINLDFQSAESWLKAYFQKSWNIDGIDGSLDIFLAEEMIDITAEYYLSFSQERESERISFSRQGGIDIEENWESVIHTYIPYNQTLTESNFQDLQIDDEALKKYILLLWNFYRSYGFVSLEFNPIALDNYGNFHMIDAVAKVDDTESFRIHDKWSLLEFPNTYGFSENAGEAYIRELDSQTGASLKLTILNSDARIWTLFAGGGGSLVMTDSLWALWYGAEIGNYGECSGNPSREFTREYTKTLLGEMLKNRKKGKYLIIAGAIANFTDVEKTFAGVIDALEYFQDDIKAQQVKILVRRGGINEVQGLTLLKNACDRFMIPATITGSDAYMTDILKEIIL